MTYPDPIVFPHDFIWVCVCEHVFFHIFLPHGSTWQLFIILIGKMNQHLIHWNRGENPVNFQTNPYHFQVFLLGPLLVRSQPP